MPNEPMQTADEIKQRLREQARKSMTSKGTALLICVTNWIDGVDTFENQGELHQEVDRLVDQTMPRLP
jgi:hypothetical protein